MPAVPVARNIQYHCGLGRGRMRRKEGFILTLRYGHFHQKIRGVVQFVKEVSWFKFQVHPAWKRFYVIDFYQATLINPYHNLAAGTQYRTHYRNGYR